MNTVIGIVIGVSLVLSFIFGVKLLRTWRMRKRVVGYAEFMYKLLAPQMLLMQFPQDTAKPPKEMFSVFMANGSAAGYILGFHDAAAQSLFPEAPHNFYHDLMQFSYRFMFDQWAGNALFSSSMHTQKDEDFSNGREIGGEDFLLYMKDDAPPMGLLRIVQFNSKA